MIWHTSLHAGEHHHEHVKRYGENVNVGRSDTWGDTWQRQQSVGFAYEVLLSDGRYGANLLHKAGDGLRTYVDGSSYLAMSMRRCLPPAGGRLRIMPAVEFMPATESALLDTLRAHRAFVCWCCPSYMHTPPPVVHERLTSASGTTGRVVVAYGVGARGAWSGRGAAAVEPALRSPELHAGRPSDYGAVFLKCVSVVMPTFISRLGGPSNVNVQMGHAFKLPGVASPVRLGDWLCMDRSAIDIYHGAVAAKRQGLPAHITDEVAIAAALLHRARARAAGTPFALHPDDYESFPDTLVVCRIESIVVIVDDSGCDYVFIVPEWYEYRGLRDVSGGGSSSPGGAARVATCDRDTGGIRGCGVATDNYILDFWPGNEKGNIPVPAHFIRRLPNVVHMCTSACKESAEPICEHEVYANLPAGMRAAFSRLCKCDGSKAVTSPRQIRRKHACGGKLDQWMLGEVELAGRGRVRWDLEGHDA